MTRKKSIYFVYNAKGGKWNYIIDTVHKYTSPNTYKCNLCQITYNFKMRKTWREYIEKSPHEFNFLHSEDLSKLGLMNLEEKLPVCLEEINGKYKILIEKEEMDNYKDEFELISSLNKILESHKS